MKEYIKKFATPDAADGYVIEDIPWMATVVSTGQNLVCNVENKTCTNRNSNVVIIDVDLAPDHTIIKYEDGTTEEIIADEYGSIDQYSFENISEVDFGKDLRTIPVEFANYSRNLRRVTIPNTVENIGSSAFLQKFTYQLSIEVPSSVTDIGLAAFCSFDQGAASMTVIFKKLRVYNSIEVSSATYGMFGDQLKAYSHALINIHFEDADSAIYAAYVQKLFQKGASKFTYTYNIYTDNTVIYNALVSYGDQYTIFNLYHFDETSWS